MKSETKCQKCDTEIVIIENKLFFSEEISDTTIECPICSSEIMKANTNGWFFIQTKKEYLKDMEIEKNKTRLTETIA